MQGKYNLNFLEALAVDDGGAGLVVFGLGDPHLLEGGEGGEDGSSDPDGVLALGGSDDLDLHGAGGKGGDLLLHAIGDSGVHGGSSGQDSVGIKVLTDINVALHDGVVGSLMDSSGLHTQEGRLEECLRATETLVSDGDDLSVGKLVGLLEGGGRGGGGHFLLEVEGDVAELLLDITDDFTLGRGGEGVTTLSEDLHEVVSQITSSQIQTEDGVGKSVSLVDGDGVGNSISGVEHDTGGTSGSVEGEDSLDGDIHGGGVEGLEHDLGHLLSVGLGIEGSLSQQDGVLLGGNTELVVEGVVPDLLHVIPVGDDAVLDGVLEGEDTSLGLGLVSDVRVLLSHTDHHSLMSGASDDRGEDLAGSVVSGEPSLAHSGSIVDNKSGNLLVAH
ncbi:hypothetical protein PMAYCL1PPCAC_29647, partial [Pristionchus mayeri]